MDDKKAFKVLASISIVLCGLIVIFNAWIAPDIMPTYKEYRQIFSLSDGHLSEIYEKNGNNYVNEEDNEEMEEDQDNDEGEEDDFILVNINEADVEELMEIPYVGEVLAERIVAYRDSYGLFESEEELLNIDGIGIKKLSKMIDYITLD